MTDFRIRAMHPGVCDRCEETYPAGAPLARHNGHWVHQHCTPGGDDE